MYLPVKLSSFQDLDLPPITYKYRKWQSSDHKRMLSHAEIHFSRPLDMDGGSELKYRLANQETGDWYEYYKSVTKQLYPNANYAEVAYNATQMLRDMLDEDRKKAPLLVEELISEHNNEWGALPLGSTPTNVHLWEFLAQSGHGFSVGLIPKKIVTHPLFWGGHVQYYPVGMEPLFRFPSIDKQTYSADTINVMISQPQGVSAEQEYRIYKYGPGQINVNKGAIQEVVIGYAMSKKSEKALVSMVNINLPDAKLFKSERDPNTNTISVIPY